ncbi:hypothetical protein [Paenibacillus sp. J2TS4]|uniref:hypothetical protein n=1 Tax=Paenibacillus sp. J2TS4 TaxID=2807194 RepID=UPI001B25AF55|nr:hypothetical protein [Paenibacillus sp. J2TS4]GIP33501.1 hypothetical protein J2TS4_27110 [Paenibacillus sp. J2TS4]
MDHIHELYTLTEGHIVTPNELLANAKLPNYEYVKFSNNGIGLHVEACCQVEEGKQVIFNYYFDNKDCLQKLVMESGAISEVIFDRIVEIEKLRSKIRNTKRFAKVRN